MIKGIQQRSVSIQNEAERTTTIYNDMQEHVIYLFIYVFSTRAKTDFFAAELDKTTAWIDDGHTAQYKIQRILTNKKDLENQNEPSLRMSSDRFGSLWQHDKFEHFHTVVPRPVEISGMSNDF